MLVGIGMDRGVERTIGMQPVEYIQHDVGRRPVGKIRAVGQLTAAFAALHQDGVIGTSEDANGTVAVPPL